MKKAVALAFAALLAVQMSGLALAGEKKDPARWQEKRVEKMVKDLDLTAEQKDKIAAVMKESDEARKAEMEKMKALRQDEEQKIKAVLTPEQAQKYDARQAKRKTKGHKKMKCPCEKCGQTECAK
jgi:Spy/CpxP family protein refolding chaperone